MMARRNKWTDPEVSVLIQGMRRHAGTPNMWASIAREGRLPPWRRPVDLKDKARNLGLIPEPSDVEAPRRAAWQVRRQIQYVERRDADIRECVDTMIDALEDEMLSARYAIAARRRRRIDPARELYKLTLARMYHTGIRGVPVTDALGCSSQEFVSYIESKLELGMTWENRGRRQGVLGWELDHIRPLSSFVLPDEWRDAFHYTNVQPLWCEDNLRKGCRDASVGG